MVHELAEFPLNDPAIEGATVLVVGPQLRLRLEPRARRLGGDAGWAIGRSSRAGRKVGFADIFESNALQNGLLAIELDEPDWEAIAAAARRASRAQPRSRSTFANKPSSFTHVRMPR